MMPSGVSVMDDTQDNMRQAEGSETEEATEGMGIDPIEAEESGDSEAKEVAGKDDPYSVKKRLGMQAKRHQRDMRAMQEQLTHLQAQMGQNPNYNSQPSNPYPSPGQPNPPGDMEEERIRKAVRFALEAKDSEARKEKEAQSVAHYHKQLQRLDGEFDKASDKYDDFDDVVRADHVPFTPAIRDALLFVDNPGEVAYKLGKNRQELDRITQLHPLDQAREVNKLSFALMGGNNGSGKASSNSRANPLNPTKASPAVNGSANYSAQSIRARMKAGTWK